MGAREAFVGDAPTRLFAHLVQVFVVVVAAVTIGLGAVLTGSYLAAPIHRSVDVLPGTDSVPALGGPAETQVFFRSVGVVLDSPSSGVRAAAWGSKALWAALIVVACAVVFLVVHRTLRGRFFSTAATSGLIWLGALAMLTAFASPWLDAQATLMGVTELGLRVYDPGQGYLDGTSGSPLDRLAPDALFGSSILRITNWPVVGLGGLLVVVGIVFARGHQLQRDTEGLV